MSSPKPYACWITIEVPLSGGRITAGVVRVDNEVRRPVGPNSDFVHAVLAAFADAGISGAPRYLGLDERGRERLSYLPGWVPPDLAHGEWSDEQLIAAGELIRRLHDALAGTALANGEETVCHNDLGPCNAVHVGGLPVAFIDWDAASPGSRVLDLGHAIWRWAIVSDTDELSLDEQVRRARLLHDAYGSAEHVATVDAITVNQERVIAASRRRGDRASVDWHTGERDWFTAHRGTFERGLS